MKVPLISFDWLFALEAPENSLGSFSRFKFIANTKTSSICFNLQREIIGKSFIVHEKSWNEKESWDGKKLHEIIEEENAKIEHNLWGIWKLLELIAISIYLPF